MTELAALVERFSETHVWVAGDVMLDQYVVGTVDRISPEAPVPVVKVTDHFSRLGGAANVARSLAGLGAGVSLCGVVGADDAAEEVLEFCRDEGIGEGALLRVSDRPTTRKLRVLGPHQQLLRLDWEPGGAFSSALVSRLMSDLEKEPAPQALILSDYAKGFLTAEVVSSLLRVASDLGIPVLVDPKGREISHFRGATLIKPNLRELEEITGKSLAGASESELAAVAGPLAESLDLEALVVTLGERGMLVATADGEAFTVPSRTRDVFDVTGAGDTAIAAMALALGSGAGLGDAVQIANAAAGLVVDEVGCASVDPEQLATELRPRGSAKIFDAGQLAEQAEAWRRRGRRIVFTNGCFDLLHAGHLALLNQAAEQGDALVVGLNSDASVTRLKGPERPLVPERERVAVLAALEFVDAVALFDEDTPLELIRVVRPDVLVKGEDYRIEDVVGREVVEAAGGEVKLVPLLAERSTSGLIERIRRGPSSRSSE